MHALESPTAVRLLGIVEARLAEVSAADFTFSQSVPLFVDQPGDYEPASAAPSDTLVEDEADAPIDLDAIPETPPPAVLMESVAATAALPGPVADRSRSPVRDTAVVYIPPFPPSPRPKVDGVRSPVPPVPRPKHLILSSLFGSTG